MLAPEPFARLRVLAELFCRAILLLGLPFNVRVPAVPELLVMSLLAPPVSWISPTDSALLTEDIAMPILGCVVVASKRARSIAPGGPLGLQFKVVSHGELIEEL
jgi:hypothetical protein